MIDDAENEAARRKYMDGMDSDIPDLDKQVDEMLTYARLEQGALDGSGGADRSQRATRRSALQPDLAAPAG